MDKNINWLLIIRFLSGDCTPAERMEIENWLKESNENREFFKNIKKIWDVTPPDEIQVNSLNAWKIFKKQLDVKIEEKNEKSLRSINKYASDHYRQRSSRFHSPWRQVLRTAAILIIMVSGLYFLLEFGVQDESADDITQIEMKEIRTEKGERRRVTLSDGTEVLLNSASSLRFPERFETTERKVELKGEALFQVRPFNNTEFIVSSGDVTTIVLSTIFNVRAWEDEDRVEVMVKEGRVAVQSDVVPGYKGIVVNEGQKSYVISGKAPSSPIGIDIDKYLSWIDGRMIFDNTSLAEVIRKLERNFDVTFEVLDPAILSYPLNANFKDESLSEILNVISITMDISIEERDDAVLLQNNNDVR